MATRKRTYQWQCTATTSACDQPQCSIGILSFDLSPGAGVCISGTISSSVPSVSWTIEITDSSNNIVKTLSGDSEIVSANWAGTGSDGRPLQAGAYNFTLKATATSSSGECSATQTKTITITPGPTLPLPQQCSDIPANSHVSPSTGSLKHDQELFSTKGSALPLNISLYYESLSSNTGALGKGWRHNYEVSISDGENYVFMRNADPQRTYTLSNGAYISPTGDYSTLVKNSNGAYTVTEKDGLKYNFGMDGKLMSIIDRNGNAMTFAYTGGNLASVTDPAGHTAAFTYDANNRLTGISDPGNNAYTFTYTTDGYLASVTNPDAGSWQYTYDASGYMLTKTKPDSQTVPYSYNSAHRLISTTDPEEKTRSYDFGTSFTSITFFQKDDGTWTYSYTYEGGNSTTFTEKDGGIWTYNYDPFTGYVTSKTDPNGNGVYYAYDSDGNMLTKTEPGNITTSYTYDSSGNMLTVTNPLNQTTTYTYNTYGQVLTATDARGTITNVYDANGNLTSVTDLSGATTTLQYGTIGRITSITNALNQATTFAYDASGNLTSITDVTGATTTFTYDANGNMLTETNSSGTTTFEYDGMNRLTKVTDPQGHTTTNTYDKMGNLLTSKDANNNTTIYEYNYKGQVTKVTDALSNQTIYNYSGTGCSSCGGGVDKLTAITDAKSQKTSYSYDLLGRLITETDPLNKAISYTYDSHGYLTSKTDAKGITITYTYDALNRLTAKTYPDATTETYTYDTKGYLTTIANSNITYNMTYDTAGRVTNVADSRGSTITYEYNTLGQRTKATYPGSKVVNYTYDTGRLQSIASDAGTFTFTYDSLSRRTGLTYPNGVSTAYIYDAVGRLTALTHSPSIASYTYTLDNVGNRTSVSGSTSATYSYDSTYRLTNAAKTKESEAYTYDAVGNRLSGPGAKDTGYAYNSANQMTAGRKLQYQYDNDGNQTARTVPNGSDKSWTQTWDYENRLVKLEKIKGTERKTVTFKYDPFGRRIEKKLVIVKGGVTKTQTYSYVYDNEDIIQETLTTDTSTEVTRYMHGPGIDEPLAIERGGQLYYFHADGLGSITAITDSTKAVKQTYTYDSFGVPKPSTNLRNAYTYTGREWDSECGLYFYRARYYDPMAGRFISEDPIRLGGGDINFYAYVGNNPVNYIDPWGLDATNWLNTQGGRASGYGPTNGNWGGGCWSGGQYSCGPKGIGNLPPTDSADACYMAHDKCYGKSCGDKKSCDKALGECLRKLPDDSKKWPQPPRPGTEGDSERYRRGAINLFGQ